MYYIYGRDNCRHCGTAVNAAEAHEVKYTYVNLSHDPVGRLLFKRAGYKTVPQVWRVEGGEPVHIGGCEDFLVHLKS